LIIIQDIVWLIYYWFLCCFNEESENQWWFDTWKGDDRTATSAWLLGMPACAEVNRFLQELTGTRYAAKQNKDTSNARQQRDMKDVHTLLFALKDRSIPFLMQTCGIS